MKVKLFLTAATLCCALPGVAQAQQYTSNLDASLRLGFELNTEPDAEISFVNRGSRLRWNGSADAGEGREAISYLEFGFDQDEGVTTTRQAWIGVTDDFGTITGGKQSRAFYDAVTSAVDIAWWNSCILEVSCGKKSGIVKFASPVTADDIRFTMSTELKADDQDNDFIDGLDFGAWKTNGDRLIGAGLTLAIGADVLNGDGNPVLGANGEPIEVGTGVALGVSVTQPYSDGTVSATLQYQNDDYRVGRSQNAEADNGVIATVAYAKDQAYGIFGLAKQNNTPFYFTVGYQLPIIEDKAFTYLELSAVEADNGADLDLQARLIMVFDMEVLNVGN